MAMLTRFRGLLLLMAAVAVLFGCSRWGSGPGEQQHPTSAWKDPVGYTVLSSVGLGENSIRLWMRDHTADICYVLEEVDANGRHRSDASGSCWDAAETDWRTDRGMGIVVFAPPRKEGASVMVTSPGGARLGPFPVHGGVIMIRDDWPHEPVNLDVQALDASGKGLEPAETVNLDAA